MQIDFYLLQVDDYRIKVIDNTMPNQINPISEIYQMNMDIVCTKVSDIQIDNIDLLPYILTYKRDKELYEITSETLGLPLGQVIPDGVYTIIITYNDVYTTTYKFCVYNTVKKEVDKLIKETNYSVIIGNYDITYTGEKCEGDIEKVRLAVALLDTLRQYAAEGNEVGCNDTLDKLNRLLTIL